MGALAAMASDLLMFVRRVREDGAVLPSEAELRQRLRQRLGEFQEQALAAGTPERDVEDARYALAAAIDEALQFSSWQGRNGWSLHPLQVELFNDRNAGVGFFQRLPVVEKRAPAVAELYYLAMGLGFRGRYHLSETDEVQRLMEHLVPVIAHPQSELMSPHALSTTPPERARSFPWLWVLLGAVVLTALVYAVLALLLSSEAATVTDALRRAG